MKKNKIINDERLLLESNKVFKICFHILCIALLIDIIYKFYSNNTFSSFNNGTWMNYIFELIILVVFLYLSLFLHAAKGIVIYAIDLPNDNFQWKRSLKVSLLVSSIISILSFILPIILIKIFKGIPEMPFKDAFMICSLLTIAVFIILFILFNINFFFAYLIAKKVNKKNS